MELRDIIRALTRRFWLLLAGAGLAMMGSYLAFRFLTPWPRYEASATVMLGNGNLGSDLASLQANRELATTYVAWATRRPVLEGVINTYSLNTSPEELRGRIDAHLVGNTQLIEISAVSPGRHEAALIANEVVRQLETEIRAALADEDDVASPSREEMAQLQERIDSTEAEIDTLTDLLLEADSTEEADLLNMRINVLQSNLDIWWRRYADVRTQLAERSPIRLIVVEKAQLPVHAANPTVNILVAGMAGLAVTTGAVLLLETQSPSASRQASFEWIARLLASVRCRVRRLLENTKRETVAASGEGNSDKI